MVSKVFSLVVVIFLTPLNLSLFLTHSLHTPQLISLKLESKAMKGEWIVQSMLLSKRRWKDNQSLWKIISRKKQFTNRLHDYCKFLAIGLPN